MSRHVSRLAGVALLLLAVATSATAQQQQGAAPARAIDPANVDTTCAACTNFFQFANGGWLKKATIPAAYSSWGSFNELADKNQETLKQIMEETSANLPKEKPGTNAWKIGTFYAACMDTNAIEAAGTTAVKPQLSLIAGIRRNADVGPALAKLEAVAGLSPMSIGATPDQRNSSVMIVSAGQGGLGMPDRDYYTKTDERSTALRAKYLEHVNNMFTLLGEKPADAKADADRVMALETALANASMTRVAMRDPQATYHKMNVAEFQKLTPHLDWKAFFRQQGVAAKVTDVNVRQPAFFTALDSMVANTPVDTWRAYLRWRAVSNLSNALPKAFADESFHWSQNLTGQKEQLPRWKRCTSATNGALGEAVGQEYVKRTFTPEAKARALHMVDNLRAALRDRIEALSWMSDTTKRQAVAKLDAFTRKIGYPDKWRDYSKLQVKTKAYAQNLLLHNQWSSARNWDKLGKPVDRTEWGMTPPTVNAYYNPVNNEIVFPAGILQPPFYDPSADDAVNYGAMGAVIGHEMTHGFDDQGRQYDAAGNLRDWWTKDDADKYNVQAQRVVDQFNGYTVVDSTTHVNGKLTLGENIADLGGLTIAYAAWQKDLAQQGVQVAQQGKIDGFTPAQRFFLGWAQVWRELRRPEYSRMLAGVDPHSPGEWRVNGPLSNMPEFKAAWGCKDGDAMVRPDSVRAKIW